jgi:acyl carrier protein
LDEFLLTSNGKVDKKALPNPEGLGISTGVEYVAPRNEMEEQLVNIWEEVLMKEKIGIQDDFFELGGHSLKATRVIAQIQKEFDIQLNIKELFVDPTISRLSSTIESFKLIKGQSGQIIESDEELVF